MVLICNLRLVMKNNNFSHLSPHYMQNLFILHKNVSLGRLQALTTKSHGSINEQEEFCWHMSLRYCETGGRCISAGLVKVTDKNQHNTSANGRYSLKGHFSEEIIGQGLSQ